MRPTAAWADSEQPRKALPSFAINRQPPVQQVQHQRITLIRQRRIVPVALIPHERVRAIHFEPLKPRPNFLQPRLDPSSAFERHVWVLPPQMCSNSP